MDFLEIFDFSSFGDFLKDLRENKLRITQREFSIKTGLTTTTISTIENGGNPRWETMQKVMTYMKEMNLLKQKVSTERVIPFLPAFPAGEACKIYNDLELETLTISEDLFPKANRAFKIKGDSMAPTLPDKAIAIAIFEPGIKLNYGNIGLIYLIEKDEHVVKRLAKGRKENEVILTSDNSAHKPDSYLWSEIRPDAKVLGYIMPEVI